MKNYQVLVLIIEVTKIPQLEVSVANHGLWQHHILQSTIQHLTQMQDLQMEEEISAETQTDQKMKFGVTLMMSKQNSNSALHSLNQLFAQLH